MKITITRDRPSKRFLRTVAWVAFFTFSFVSGSWSQIPRIPDSITKIVPVLKPSVSRPVEVPATQPGTIDPLTQVGGRMVFSTSPINPANPANLTNDFKAGEPIYGALLLKGSLREFVTDQSIHDSTRGFSVTRPGVAVDFQIDDMPLYDGTTSFVFQLEEKEGALEAVPMDNFLIFDVSPAAANAKTYQYAKMHFPLLSAVGRANNKAKAGAQYYSFHLGKLKPGSHTVTFTVTGKTKIVGNLRISGDDFAFYKRAADALDSVAAANTALPRSQWNDPVVARSVTAAYRKQPGEQILRTILVSPDWFIQRNSLGLIIHRGLFAVLVTKAADGKCYMQREYFKQFYRGRGYGPTQQDGRSETRQALPCTNIPR